jgi:hypothetical protein
MKSSLPGFKSEFFEYIDGVLYNFKAAATGIGNDGIGPYEFWGSRGFDAGRDYVEDYEISELTRDDGKALTKKKAKYIKNRIYLDGPLNDKILEQLEQDLMSWNEVQEPEELEY